MKKFLAQFTSPNWANLGLMVIVGVVVVGIVYPFARPTLKKIPGLGERFA
jgi:hypothetical protein